MAKRKRLTPAENAALESDNSAAPETKAMGSHPFGVQPVAPRRPPIAQVAGDAAAQAALEEVAGELHAAKTSGRMVLELALDVVDETYLVRDRLVAAADELEVLMASLKARGQQVPIEVVDLGKGRYGLISGWRRLTALRNLQALDGQGGKTTVQALLRQPETASDAYLAMVEENEIRVGLSYYERARIVARAAQLGAFHNEERALKGLFGSVSRAKRSKIGSFLRLYNLLDDRLRFPSAITERLGLALVKALEAEPDLTAKLRDRLRKTVADTAAQELAVLERSLGKTLSKRSLSSEIETDKDQNTPVKPPIEVAPGIQLTMGQGRLVLSGKGVDAALHRDLLAWLAGR